jgi:dephospho-CoA kinase
MPDARRPIAVAITGGIGAGKSTLLAAFERHGAATISSDEIVHRLLREPDVRDALVGRWGDGVLGRDGSVDRRTVGRIVFGNRAELEWLEALLHPRVVAVYMRWRDELAALPSPPDVCATEVPLLYETGGETRFDAVVAVTASTEARVSRTVRPDLALREQRLIPDEEKLRRADFGFVNDGSLEQLDAFVAEVMATLVERRRERLAEAAG